MRRNFHSFRTWKLRFHSFIYVVSVERAEEAVKAAILNSLLKKRKREEEWVLGKKEVLEATKKKSVENRRLINKRAKKYAEEYVEQENELIRLKREAKLKGGFYVVPDASYYLSSVYEDQCHPPEDKKDIAALATETGSISNPSSENATSMNSLEDPY